MALEVQAIIDKKATNKMTEKQANAFVAAQTDRYLKDIEAWLRPSVVRTALWVYAKIWQRAYD